MTATANMYDVTIIDPVIDKIKRSIEFTEGSYSISDYKIKIFYKKDKLSRKTFFVDPDKKDDLIHYLSFESFEEIPDKLYKKLRSKEKYVHIIVITEKFIYFSNDYDYGIFIDKINNINNLK
jgi:hypothetical protein